MFNDFSLWLICLTTLLGVIWGIDALLFRRGRRLKQVTDAAAATAGHTPATPRDPILVEYAGSFFPVLLLVLLVRSFIFEPFRIPSDSMMPTLLAGDFIFVSKFSYGLRVPVLGAKLIPTGDPQRGDVVVFRLPADPSVNYIKRLIGLPGDHVQVVNDQVFVNGEPLKVELGGLYNEHGYTDGQLGMETIGAMKHQLMYLPGAFPRDFDAVVPAGHYYFMGDNRDNSQDSRFPQVGFVPEANLVGHAKLIWFHWKFDELPIWSRIGTSIH